MADALAEINIDLLPIYYQWLVDIEEHYDALRTFQAFVKAADLSDPINSAIVKTAVDRGSLVILAERINNNDPGSKDVLKSILTVLGQSAVRLAQEKEEQSYTTNISDEKNAPDPKLYPPDCLNDFLEELETRNIIVGRDDRINDWASYWISEGRQEDVYQALKSVAEQRSYFENYDLLITLALQLFGAEAAYPWLVRAQKEDRAWFHYFVQKEKILPRWDVIKKYYPDRWYRFICETFSLGSHSFLHLVEYCIYVGQLELALQLMERMVSIALELVSPLNLPVPEWIRTAEATK